MKKGKNILFVLVALLMLSPLTFANVELFIFQRGERSCRALKAQPAGLVAPRMEEHEIMAAADEFIAELEITADSSKDLDVGKQSGHFHFF